MPYTVNPHLPKLRAKAVIMVRNGQSIRQVAKYFGFNPSTICRWVRRAPEGNFYELSTRSSRPKSHPKVIDWRIRKKIVELRLKTKGRCSEVIQQMLLNEDIKVSLNTGKRTLRKQGLIKHRSPWKKYHLSGKRPEAVKPGIDTLELENPMTMLMWRDLIAPFNRNYSINYPRM